MSEGSAHDYPITVDPWYYTQAKTKIIPVFFNLGHSQFIVISKSARLVRTARTRSALPLFTFENTKYLLKCESFGISWLF